MRIAWMGAAESPPPVKMIGSGSRNVASITAPAVCQIDTGSGLASPGGFGRKIGRRRDWRWLGLPLHRALYRRLRSRGLCIMPDAAMGMDMTLRAIARDEARLGGV